MNCYYPPANDEAVQSPADALAPAGPELEQPVAHRARLRHAQIRTELQEKVHQARVVSQNARRPMPDLVLDVTVEVLKGVRPRPTLAEMRTRPQAPIRLHRSLTAWGGRSHLTQREAPGQVVGWIALLGHPSSTVKD